MRCPIPIPVSQYPTDHPITAFIERRPFRQILVDLAETILALSQTRDGPKRETSLKGEAAPGLPANHENARLLDTFVLRAVTLWAFIDYIS